jgi:hypothetical protein
MLFDQALRIGLKPVVLRNGSETLHNRVVFLLGH